jgi:hypothetical protein
MLLLTTDGVGYSPTAPGVTVIVLFIPARLDWAVDIGDVVLWFELGLLCVAGRSFGTLASGVAFLHHLLTSKKSA